MSTLQNKVALVTGASRGIGAAIARDLASDGATVILTYNSSAEQAEAVAKEITTAGGRAEARRFNARQTDGAGDFLASIAADHGGLDILVNNAGVYVTAPLSDSDANTLDDNFAVNVRGVHETTRAALPHLRDNGRIINIGSGVAYRAFPGAAAYGASKAAVNAMARSWAKELGERGITVNTVNPGSIDTEMNPADGEYGDFQRSLNVFGRYGRPEEISSVVAFLAGPRASFITGASINVDGGFTI